MQKYWTSVTISKDGKYLAATAKNNSGTTTGGGIWYSDDGGSFWKQASNTTNLNWLLITSSSDGKYLYAVYETSKIFRSTQVDENKIRQFDLLEGDQESQQPTPGQSSYYSISVNENYDNNGNSLLIACLYPTEGLPIAILIGLNVTDHANLEWKNLNRQESQYGPCTDALINNEINKPIVYSYFIYQGWVKSENIQNENYTWKPLINYTPVDFLGKMTTNDSGRYLILSSAVRYPAKYVYYLDTTASSGEWGEITPDIEDHIIATKINRLGNMLISASSSGTVYKQVIEKRNFFKHKMEGN